MSRLQGEVQQREEDVGSAEGQISTMKEAQDKLLEELDATRARLRETSNLLTALQVGRRHTHTGETHTCVCCCCCCDHRVSIGFSPVEHAQNVLANAT